MRNPDYTELVKGALPMSLPILELPTIAPDLAIANDAPRSGSALGELRDLLGAAYAAGRASAEAELRSLRAFHNTVSEALNKGNGG